MKLHGPFYWLDVWDYKNNRPDNQKILMTTVVLSTIVLAFLGKPLDAATVTVLGVISGGSRMIAQYLRQAPDQTTKSIKIEQTESKL